MKLPLILAATIAALVMVAGCSGSSERVTVDITACLKSEVTSDVAEVGRL